MRSALAALLAAIGVIALAPPVQATRDGEPTSTQDGSSYTVWLANTYRAIRSQGSTCPWRYVGTVAIPGTAESIGDARDPGTGRMVRLFADCNDVIHEVLEPTAGDVVAELVAQVRTEIPTPVVEFEPRHSGTQAATVNVDTWTWVGNDAGPITKSGGLLGITATITATPTVLTTDWGDGATTPCRAPGIDYRTVPHPTLERAPDPGPAGACTHRYRHHSGGQPGGAFSVTSSLTWTGTWTSGNGYSGTFDPITKRTTTPVKVHQVQSVNTAG